MSYLQYFISVQISKGMRMGGEIRHVGEADDVGVAVGIEQQRELVPSWWLFL
jgi:hypothetical protein